MTMQAEGWSPAHEERLDETTFQEMLLNPGPQHTSCESRGVSLRNNKEIYLMISRDDMHHIHHDDMNRDRVTGPFSQDTAGLPGYETVRVRTRHTWRS